MSGQAPKSVSQAASVVLQTLRNLSISVANDMERADGLVGAGNEAIEAVRDQIVQGIDEKIGVIKEYNEAMDQVVQSTEELKKQYKEATGREA